MTRTKCPITLRVQTKCQQKLRWTKCQMTTKKSGENANNPLGICPLAFCPTTINIVNSVKNENGNEQGKMRCQI